MNPTSLKLNAACSAGKLEEVRHLLDEGADPNSADEHGCGTLLTFHPQMIEFLLSRGADPNIQKNQAGASVLAGLAYVNQLECVRLLLNAGANVHRGREESDETPLHHALVSRLPDRTPLVKLLLDRGADPNAKTKPGIYSFNYGGDLRTRAETPLHRAAAYSPADTIMLLMEAGGDTTIRDINGDSPGTWALWHLREKSVLNALTPK
ncbi:MAG: ankyrin repeat domain-containing protein [Verrucomicrobiales bacterium]